MSSNTLNSTSSTFYDGKELTSLVLSKDCLPTVNEVIEKIDAQLALINKSLDLSTVVLLPGMDKSKVTLVSYLSALADNFKLLKDTVNKNQINKDKETTSISVDLSSLGKSAIGLEAILSVLVDEIYNLKNPKQHY